jgi:hypothetical protein
MPPQQDMGIEEHPHASPSQKASGSGSSKSSAITAAVFLDASGYRDLFASDGYPIHSGMGKDQALEFIEV